MTSLPIKPSTTNVTERPGEDTQRSLLWPKLVHILPLAAIVGLLFLSSLTLSNTTERDEALYIHHGRLLATEALGGPATDRETSRYFSGLPYLYPVMAGLADLAGGLQMVRMLSLIAILIATGCVFYVTRTLFDDESAALAAAFFVIQPAIVFLSRYATFDAAALACLGLAAVFAMRAGDSGRLSSVLLTGLFSFLAVGAKYAAALYVPSVLFLMFWRMMQASGWNTRSLMKAANAILIVIGVIIFGFLVFVSFDPNLLQGLSFTTTNREAMALTQRDVLLADVLTQIGVTIVVSLAGLIFVRFRHMLLSLMLFGTLLLAPAYHLYKMESVSMHKHLGFGALFASALAGYALMHLRRVGSARLISIGSLAVMAVFLLMFSVGLSKARGFYSWNSSDDAVRALRTLVRPGESRILSDELEILNYGLRDITTGSQWASMYGFVYEFRPGEWMAGEAGLRKAIDDGFFDVIAFGFDRTDEISVATRNLAQYLESAPQYKLTYVIPNWYWGRNDMLIWRRE